ncbi:type II toxin-antitoxin system Phd/YefM family antitoxin [Rhizobium sp. FY34]|uniref:type II toxin-antitoxin system Phd/YefM family antitoxin n=1 Tax=Rhizobium sp. FY34 TaxID=2562309 RepID=UPI0010C0EECF|nr:type II toxin-antitoxin system Phd/YefM family antitoxin [Rhizobium sp. FY34]
MRHVTIAEAKENFDALIALVRSGERIVLTEGGQSIVELKAMPAPRQPVDIEALQRDLAELRASMTGITLEELMNYRHEGHNR